MKKPEMTIHQFTAGSAFGDAVTNSTLFIKNILDEENITNHIYAGHVAPEFYGTIEPYYKLKAKKEDIILIHHAIGHGLNDWLIKRRGKKVIVYHNITPEKFFPEDSPVRDDIRLGHQQLKDFVNSGTDHAISISDYNKSDLLDAGFKEDIITTIPLLLDFEKITQKPFNADLVKVESDLPTILFVGRISPNKCQHELLEVAHYLRSLYQKPFQFIIAGNYSDNDPYFIKLKQRHQELELQDWVQFTGKISEEDLYGWYRAADCFLCLSEHEGFGVPIVEAMAFDVPVIGFNAANVPFLLENAGITINEKNIPAIAALLKEVLENNELKQTIKQAQATKLQRFAYSNLKSQFLNYIHDL